MKSCPTCKRTFEDTFTFCLIDGSILSAPFDPLATRSDQGVRDTSDQRTEVLTSSIYPRHETLAPTVASPTSSAERVNRGDRGRPANQPDPPAPAALSSVSWSGEKTTLPNEVSNKLNRRQQWIIGLFLMIGLGFAFGATQGPRLFGIWIFRFTIAGALGAGIAVLVRRKLWGVILAFVGGISLSVFSGAFLRQSVLDIGEMGHLILALICLIGWGVTRLVATVLGRKPVRND